MIYRFASCVLNSRLRELTVDGAPVHVEPQVFDVLRYLLDKRDCVVSRDELIEAVWHGRIVSETTISARIWAARQAVGDTGDAQAVIRTVPRRGFHFVAAVTVEEPSIQETDRPAGESGISSGSQDPGARRLLPLLNRWHLSLAAASILLFVAAMGFLWVAEADRGGLIPRDERSIAVMPFDTFSNDEDQQFLAQGIAEDITTALALNSELTVMARTATFHLDKGGLSASEVASELEVRYILGGSVRRAGEELRISAQLIDSDTGNHIWADRYDATASSLYETQDIVVEKIVGTMLSKMRETEKRAILRRPPSNLDVYELTLRGLARKHRLNAEDLRLARQDLLRAVELDPQYAPAWLYLGWVESIAIVFKWIDGVELDEAIRKIEKAIELEPTMATAYQALGIARSMAGDAQGSLRAARRSVELGPGDADNLLFLGRALAINGEFDEAIVYGRHAMALNPSRPSYYASNLGKPLWGRGDLEETSRLMDECLTKAPGFTACHIFRIASHAELGNFDRASKAVMVLREQSPGFSVEDAVKSAGFAGDPAANERLAKHLIEAGLPSDRGPPATE